MKNKIFAGLVTLLVLFFAVQTAAVAQSQITGTGTVLLVKLKDNSQMSIVRGVLMNEVPKLKLHGFFKPKDSFVTLVESTAKPDVETAEKVIASKLPGCTIERKTVDEMNALYTKAAAGN
jgi:hypothetical protein